jgi:predicted choloylglycine hydrolase
MFSILTIEGNYYEVGREIGRFCKDATLRWLGELKQHPEFNRCLENIDPYIEVTKNFLPTIADEIHGMSDGIGIDFRTCFLLNTRELLDQIEDVPFRDHCTVAVSYGSNGLMVGHNEDDESAFDDLDDLYLLKAKINGMETMSLAYKGIVPGTSISVNDNGLVHCINEVDQLHTYIGVPKLLLASALTTAENLPAAERILTQIPMASGLNYVLAQDETVINVEVAGQTTRTTQRSQQCFVHTNHYLDPKIQALEKSRSESSVHRYFRANEMIKDRMTIDEMAKLLSDRADLEFPISRPNATLGSVIVEPMKREFRVCYGPPNSIQDYLTWKY